MIDSRYTYQIESGIDSPPLDSLWTHPLLIPSYAILASILVLFLQLILSSGPIKALRARTSASTENTGTAGEHSADSTRTGLVSAVKEHVKRSGGTTIFVYNLSRLVVVLSLLFLSIFSFLREEEHHQQHLIGSGLSVHSLGKHRGKKRKHKHRDGGDSFSEREWLDLALCLTYVCSIHFLFASISRASHSHSYRPVILNSFMRLFWLWSPHRPGEPAPLSRHSISLPYC